MRSSICGSCAAQSRAGGCATARSARKRGTSSGWIDLQVREVVAAVPGAVRAERRLDGVEALADGAVGEGVEVHLEAGGVERVTVFGALGLDEGVRARSAALAVEVGSNTAAVKVSARRPA